MADDNSFFGVLGGTVKNLGFVNVDMQDDEQYLAAYSVIASRSMAAVAGKLGSGAMPALVENCFVTGNIQGGLVTGAIAGAVEGNSTLKNVFAQAQISSPFEVCGGLVGYVNDELTIQNAYFAGQTSSEKAIACAIEEGKTLTAQNTVDWTTAADANAQYHFNGNNHSELQKTVVAFDPAVWGCSMQEGEYPVLKLFGDTLPNAIQGITAGAHNTLYDLQGRKMVKAQRGLYIMNGRKVAVK